MLNMFYVRIISLVIFASVVRAEYSCPNGWAHKGDYCYWMSNAAYGATTARSVCQNFGGDLMAQNSPEEQTFTESIISQRQHDILFGLKQNGEGVWEWTDGSQPGPLDANIVNWACEARPEAPCNAGEGVGPCGVYRWHSLKWENHPCDWFKPFMCRRSYYVKDNCDLANDWHQYAQKCYKSFTDEKSWRDARDHCESLGASLVMLKTTEEIKTFEHLQFCTDYSARVWLGLSDTESPGLGTLWWIDNTTLSATDWAPDEPSNSNPHRDNCVAAVAIEFNKWRTMTCSQQNQYMCQKSYGVCSEGWNDYGDTGHCYLLVTAQEQHLTWHEAKESCAAYSKGSQLMKVTDATEQNLAMKGIYTALSGSGLQSIRIGISDEYTDNQWRWADNQYPSYVHWNDSWREEVEERMDCGFVDLTANNPDAKWGTNYCFDKKAYICRIPKFERPAREFEVEHKLAEQKQDPALQASTCEEGWMLDGDRCYWFIDELLQYSDAKSRCTDKGAKVITIRNADEQVFISNNQRGETWHSLVYTGTHWQYDDGTDQMPSFKNWAADGRNEQSSKTCCKLQYNSLVGQWYNAHCTNEQYNTICQKQATYTTDPPPTETPNATEPWSPECGPGWVYDPFAERCFGFRSGVQVSWEEARRRCVEENADLASISGTEEQQFIIASLIQQTAKATYYWIGLNDREQSKGWRWSNGDAVPYFNWNDGEPNNYSGEEWCVEFATTSTRAYRWNDHNCSSLADGYVCKKRASTYTTENPIASTTADVSCTRQPMVSGDMYVTDSNIRAKDYREGREPWKARMTSSSSWRPVNDSIGQHISVHFPFQRKVEGITIAGHTDNDEYVTKFTVLYQAYDGVSQWQNVFNGSSVMIFTGNDASNYKEGAFQFLPYRLYAQSVRIYPQEWNQNIAMRIDVDGCVYPAEVCEGESSVGGTVWALDNFLTASNSKAGFEATEARYSRTGWEAADPVSESQYLQVEFETRMTVIAIGTKGRSDAERFVTAYKMQYYDSLSPHDDKWSTYQEPFGTDKVFNANTNNVDEVVNYLAAEVTVEMVRIIPTSFYNGKAMRLEVYSCLYGCSVQQVISGDNYQVEDWALQASSSFDGNHGPHRSRLNTIGEGGQAGAWCALTIDQNQWIMVDLDMTMNIRGIATQGREDYDQWIKSFHVEYSYTGDVWQQYRSDRSGNNTAVYYSSQSRNSIRKNYFEPLINARHIRIRPREWQSSICTRWDVLACPGPYSSETLGCYADQLENRDLPYAMISDSEAGMTHQICSHHCFTNGYIYAGVQYASECWCGNSYGKYGQSSSCTMTCTGDPYQICGGSRANWVMTTGLSPSNRRCDDGWTEFQENCYKFVKKQTDVGFSWNQARYLCQQEGAELASILSVQENDFVWVEVDKMKENAWIGLHSMRDHMFFEWSNYDEVTYTNWARREPNALGSVEDCVNFYYYSGQWNDDKCDTNNYGAYVCQKGKESLPPATSPTPDPGCGAGWMKYRWKCYHFATSLEWWTRHRDNCQGIATGATLARIEDNSEQAFLSSMITELGGGSFFFDLNDRDNPGDYRFSDGSAPWYTHWGMNQPDETEVGSCVAINSTDNNLWYDLNCDTSIYAVCEKPHDTETRPPTSATPPATGNCPNGWQEFGDHCYIVRYEEDPMRLDWDAAQAWCSAHSANLTSVHSDEESQFLLSIQPENNANYWIGLARATNNDSWTWADGSAVGYARWAEEEPGPEIDHNCVQYRHEDAHWETMTCYSHRCYICKTLKGIDISIPSTEPYPTPDPDGNCDPNGERWKYYNGMCYFFSDVVEQDDEFETWYDAEAFCNSKGGYLASMHSEDEARFCMGQARNINSKWMWIGLNDLYGGEQWTDNTPVDYVYWAPGQPNDGGGTERCVGMGVNADNFGPWSQLHCSEKYSYICKKTPGNEVPPTTPLPTASPGNCPDGYMPFLDKCYKFFEEYHNWTYANQKCKEQNNDTNQFTLATIHNLQEQSFITAQLVERRTQYWIGLHLVKGDTGNGFGWVDNTQVTYTNWGPYEPNGAENEQCTEMMGFEEKAGMWNDLGCANTLKFICMTHKSVALSTPPPEEPGPCANYGTYAGDYIYYNGDCFKTTENLRTWQEAETHCSDDAPGRGHLASIRNGYEQAFVYSYMLYHRDGAMGTDNAWIGLSDYQQPGRFLWTDNSYVTYTNWGDNEPSRPEGGCVQFAFANSSWHDEDCSVAAKAVCRINEQPNDVTRPPTGQCPSTGIRDYDWQEFGTACYLFVAQKLSYGNARFECNKLGGDLASVPDNNTNAFIQSMIQAPVLGVPWWIGMYRSPSNGFAWINGDPVAYTNWARGEPSDVNGTYAEDCVEMYMYDGTWNDINCNAGNGFICSTSRIISTSNTPEIPPDGTTSTSPGSTRSTPPLTVSTVGPTSPGGGGSTPKPTTPGDVVEIGEPKEPLPPGAIVGIVFGVVAIILAALIVLLVAYKRRVFINAEGMSNPLYQESSSTTTA